MLNQLTEQQFKDSFKQATASCILLFKTLDDIDKDKTLDENIKQKVKQNLEQYRLQLQEFLEETWSSLCLLYIARTEGWIEDATFRGYLVTTSPSRTVRVPYHLADYFPNKDVVDELCRIASSVQFSPDGLVCISGSSTFLEALKYISDIDYCEYVPYDKNTEWCDKFADDMCDIVERNNEMLICLKGKIIDSSDPEQEQIIRQRADRETLNLTNLSRAKLDFMTLFLKDVIEVTNLILPVDKTDSNDAVLEKSSALQEAPITEGTWIPQRLLNPISLGKYVDWLIEQIDDKDNKGIDPIKAAKRALSLARITGFWEEGNSIIDVLVRENFTQYAAWKARKRLEPTVQELSQRNPQVAQNFLNALQKTLKNLEVDNPHEEKSDSIEELKRIFTNLLNKIQEEIAKVQPNV